MAKAFIRGNDLIRKQCGSKMACLKIYREHDDKELCITFDNSLGEFKDECKKIEAYIYPDNKRNDVESVHQLLGSEDLAMLIMKFVTGKDLC